MIGCMLNIIFIILSLRPGDWDMNNSGSVEGYVFITIGFNLCVQHDGKMGKEIFIKFLE